MPNSTLLAARIARTGILHYHSPNGGVRREYRPASEVFNADSLATLAGCPVIDIADHTALITKDTLARVARGVAGAGKQSGKYVHSTLRIDSDETLSLIDRGERSEISAGYVCSLEMTPGTLNGEPYDCVQRNIRFNHVALCPLGRGRSGSDVSLRLDAFTVDRGVARFDSVVRAFRLDAATPSGIVYDASPFITGTGEISCACKVKRDTAGRLAKTDECSCVRDDGVVNTNYGPRIIQTPVARDEKRIDARPLRTREDFYFAKLSDAAASLKRRMDINMKRIRTTKRYDELASPDSERSGDFKTFFDAFSKMLEGLQFQPDEAEQLKAAIDDHTDDAGTTGGTTKRLPGSGGDEEKTDARELPRGSVAAVERAKAEQEARARDAWKSGARR